MTVAENIFIGREPSRGGFVDRRTLRQNTRELLDRLGVRLDPARWSATCASPSSRWSRSPGRSL